MPSLNLHVWDIDADVAPLGVAGLRAHRGLATHEEVHPQLHSNADADYRGIVVGRANVSGFRSNGLAHSIIAAIVPSHHYRSQARFSNTWVRVSCNPSRGGLFPSLTRWLR